MKVFNNLVWVCGYIGFISDSFTVFMNLHDKKVNYKIARDRMRVTNPGMILNWAWYYPRWKNEQVDDPNLYKQITLDESLNFAQASFVMREKQLLDKFPGSRTITLMAENTASIEYYLAYFVTYAISIKAQSNLKLRIKKVFNGRRPSSCAYIRKAIV